MFQFKNLAAFFFSALVSLLCSPSFGQTTVVNTNDSGAGSLRAAISSGGFIDFDPVLFSMPQTITLATSFGNTSNSFSINGPGANLLTIEGAFTNDEIFFINSGVVNLNGITLSGTSNTPTANGPDNGIFLRGDLTLENSVIRGFQDDGIFSQGGTLTVLGSTISNNGAEGIFDQTGTATVNSSTIANNGGSGVFNQGGATNVNNSTIVNNGDNGIFGFANINSSIVANNAGGDLFSFSGVSANSSLIENTGLVANGVNGNIVGVDPLLGPLSNNGGGTPTFLLGTNSPAIDAGSNPLGLAFDQRGVSRVIGAQIDIGATETVPEPSGFGLAYVLGLAFLSRRNRLAA